MEYLVSGSDGVVGDLRGGLPICQEERTTMNRNRTASYRSTGGIGEHRGRGGVVGLWGVVRKPSRQLREPAKNLSSQEEKTIDLNISLKF